MLWLVTIPRIVLGIIFASAAVSYFWMEAFGWPLLPVRISDHGLQFALSIIQVGCLWPLMKSINLVAGFLLIVNRAPAFALAISSYIIKRRPVTLVERFEKHAETLSVSVMTAAELRFGAEDGESRYRGS
jgi:hypothetical protein